MKLTLQDVAVLIFAVYKILKYIHLKWTNNIGRNQVHQNLAHLHTKKC